MAVFDVLTAAGHQGASDGGPGLLEVAEAYTTIEAAPGPARKGSIFQRWRERAHPLTAKYIVKVLTGELRIGLREGLLEAALAQAFERPLVDVKGARRIGGGPR